MLSWAIDGRSGRGKLKCGGGPLSTTHTHSYIDFGTHFLYQLLTAIEVLVN